nr:uncharacterized protein LOC114825110 [Malus domestica]
MRAVFQFFKFGPLSHRHLSSLFPSFPYRSLSSLSLISPSLFPVDISLLFVSFPLHNLESNHHHYPLVLNDGQPCESRNRSESSPKVKSPTPALVMPSPTPSNSHLIVQSVQVLWQIQTRISSLADEGADEGPR